MPTEPTLSLAICSHNPRRPTLQRVVDALRAQTVPADRYEFLVVDNASEPALASWLDLGWHPRARFVVETELGISKTRQRALQESTGELLLYVDDDNVVAPDFVERSLEIAVDHPHLGVWGPATIRPEFEQPPSPELLPFTGLLMHYEHPHDLWSNFRFGNDSVPPTAGMTLRRFVGEQWIRNNETSALRRGLGRRGTGLLTGGDDVDLSLTACDLGLGTGVFVRLVMTHVYHPGRVDPAYLERLWEGNMFSDHILNHIRGIKQLSARQWLLQDLKDWLKPLTMNRTERIFHAARVRGQRKARAFLKEFQATGREEVRL